MKTLHTPGPWLQSWGCDAPTGSDASPKYDGFEVCTELGWPVAFLPIHFVFPPVRAEMNKRELDWDEASANLRLVSAAPELLSALRLTLLALEAISAEMTVGERYTNAGQHLLDALNPARKAIAKATGGAA